MTQPEGISGLFHGIRLLATRTGFILERPEFRPTATFIAANRNVRFTAFPSMALVLTRHRVPSAHCDSPAGRL